MKKWLKRIVAVLLVPVGLSGLAKHEQAEPIIKGVNVCSDGGGKCTYPDADHYLGAFGIEI